MRLAAFIRRLAACLDPLHQRTDQPAAEQNWMDDQEDRLRHLEQASHEHRLDLLNAEANLRRRRLQLEQERKAKGYG